MSYKIGDQVEINNQVLKIINIVSLDYKKSSPAYCDLYFVYVLSNVSNNEIISLMPWQLPNEDKSVLN